MPDATTHTGTAFRERTEYRAMVCMIRQPICYPLLDG